MAFTRNNMAVNNISNQPDKPVISATALKALFDQSDSDEKAYVNNVLLPEIEATTDGDSGADNIGATPLAGGTANTVQGIVEELNAKATSGVNALNTHKASADHDGRYYTEAEVNALLLANQQGNHLGTWQGYTPTFADPGIASVVAEHTNQISNIKSQKLDIKDFGGVGDGITNDTVAIQSLINAAGSNHEAVISKGKFYVNNPITFKAYAKIKFEGSEIVTDSNFIGDAVFYCNSVSGDSDGYLLNPKFVSTDERTNATAIIFDHTQNFRIYNLVTRGYIKGGLHQKGGYELIINGFSVIAPVTLPTRDFPLLQPGVYLQSSDGEITNGSVVAYPVGLRTFANNGVSHVHCWGIPSTGAITDTRIMLYPFIATEKGNNFVNCFADTPDILDITGLAGGLNGGIGFLDANTNVIVGAFPTQNSYINCRVLKRNETTNNKIFGFAYGDTGINSIGNFTKIIAPTFQGTGYAEQIKCYNINAKRYSTIINEQDQSYTVPIIVSSRVTNLSGGFKQTADRVFVQLKFTSSITANGTVPLEGFPLNSSATVSHSALNVINLTDSTNGYANIAVTNGNMNADLISGKVYVVNGWYSIS